MCEVRILQFYSLLYYLSHVCMHNQSPHLHLFLFFSSSVVEWFFFLLLLSCASFYRYGIQRWGDKLSDDGQRRQQTVPTPAFHFNHISVCNCLFSINSAFIWVLASIRNALLTIYITHKEQYNIEGKKCSRITTISLRPSSVEEQHLQIIIIIQSIVVVVVVHLAHNVK